MREPYALLLSLIGLICIVFNRFAVEEALRWEPLWAWWKIPPALGRVVVVIAGIFFVLFGLLKSFGYLN